MENKNGDFRNKPEEEKTNDLSHFDPSDELQSDTEEKFLGNNVAQDNSSGVNFDNQGEKEESLRKKILNENKLMENISNNVSAESKEINESPIDSNKNFFRAKKKNKNRIIPIILGVVLMLIVGSVAAYFLINKKLEEKKESPQQIIKSSMEAMNGIKSYAFEGNVDVNASSEGNLADRGDAMNFSVAMKFNGQSDQSDSNNIRSSFNISPEINIFTEGGNEDFSFDFSLMSFGKVSEQVIYYKLNDFDLGAAGIMYGKMIVPYKNKWYFMDMKELQEKGGVSAEENNFDFEKMMEKMTELYRKCEMIKFKSDLGDAEINRQKAYHYQVEIDSEAMLGFYVDSLKIISSESALSPNDNYLATSDDDFEDFESELEKNRKEILAVLDEVMANVETEIWIGKEDKIIYKMAISGKFDQELMKRLEKARKKEDDIKIKPDPEDYPKNELSFDIAIIMSDFNQPVEIFKPKEAENLMKIIEEALGGLLGSMTPNSLGNDFDSDDDGLSDEAEEVYGTDKNNPDTDGDGYSDGEEVNSGYDPAISGDARLDYDKLFNAL